MSDTDEITTELARLRAENARLVSEVESWKHDCKQALAEAMERGNNLQRHKQMLEVRDAALKKARDSISVLLECFEVNHDEGGLHQPLSPVLAIDYEEATDALAAINEVLK